MAEGLNVYPISQLKQLDGFVMEQVAHGKMQLGAHASVEVM